MKRIPLFSQRAMVTCMLSLAAHTAQAQTRSTSTSVAQPRTEPAEEPSGQEQVITVVGSSQRSTPGSVTAISSTDLQHLAPQNAGDALRTAPGVNVVAEDSMGLRLNIGIRGLDPNRSRKVLILEDGLPLSLNPYGSPELYYSPPIERMDRIEVVRGSGQILWGPQTIGGVINYITKDPPRRPTVSAELRYGSMGYFLAQAEGGLTQGPIGLKLEIAHRRFDGPRQLALALTDITARVRLEITPRSVLRAKFNFYDEQSNATYVGITTPQFLLNPYLQTATNDHFSVHRYALSVIHRHEFSNNAFVQTSVYAYQTHRAWRRQEFDRTDQGLEYERICDPTGRCDARGTPGLAPTNDGGSLYYRNSSAIRNRLFHVAGIESRLTLKWASASVFSGEFTGVVRLHRESADEAIEMTSPTGTKGDPHNAELRNGYALAAAVQHRFTLWRKLHITPGLRIENFWSDRRIVRVPTTRADGSVTGLDTNIAGQTFSWAVMPGLGLAWDVATPFTLYSGIHRGYAPPRTRDAVSAAGENLQLEPELSWNAELGFRLKVGRWLNIDTDAFLLEFENQIIPPSEAGGTVSGGNFNSGRSRHVGLESSTTFDLGALLKDKHFALPLSVSYTWVPVAMFVGGLFDGNRLPYAPEHLLNLRLRLVHDSGFSTQATLQFVSSQFADRENTQFPTANGLIGEIPAAASLDLRVAYTWKQTGLTFGLNGRNLTNQITIASRAPQGIQPSGYFQLFGSLEWTWPNS